MTEEQARSRRKRVRWTILIFAILVASILPLTVTAYELETSWRLSKAQATLKKYGYLLEKPASVDKAERESRAKLDRVMAQWERDTGGALDFAPIHFQHPLDHEDRAFYKKHRGAIASLKKLHNLQPVIEHNFQMADCFTVLLLAAMVEYRSYGLVGLEKNLAVLQSLEERGLAAGPSRAVSIESSEHMLIQIAASTSSLEERQAIRSLLLKYVPKQDLHSRIQDEIWVSDPPYRSSSLEGVFESYELPIASHAIVRRRAFAVEMEYFAAVAEAASDGKLMKAEADAIVSRFGRGKHRQWPSSLLLNRLGNTWLCEPTEEDKRHDRDFKVLQMDLLIEFAGGPKAVIPRSMKAKKSGGVVTVIAKSDEFA